MGHQRKLRPMLEPVLENYMGPPISYTSSTRADVRTSTKPSGRSAKKIARVAPAVPAEPSTKHGDEHHASKGVAAPGKFSSMNPVTVLGKLRDRYVKAMNEVAVAGDLASVAGYHGCVAASPGAEYSYPGVLMGEPEQHDRQDHHRSSAASREELEIRALRKELAARRRKAEDLRQRVDANILS